ncbi:uncharacterized protein TrAtP1_004321 [Trichoderma atroviride]|uniref:uncharacterized protein n=1 Tax=Hypocrea atroviridis TaxID=63577 RepID=UPI00332AE54D|nr:hypothetical protein TrAtP1_004321 [Trichoderma atroviride]
MRRIRLRIQQHPRAGDTKTNYVTGPFLRAEKDTIRLSTAMAGPRCAGTDDHHVETARMAGLDELKPCRDIPTEPCFHCFHGALMLSSAASRRTSQAELL